MKPPASFLPLGCLIFGVHLFFAFAVSAENLVNPFTFPLMQWLVSAAKNSEKGDWALTVGLFMYPTMIVNSIAWSLVTVGFAKAVMCLVQKRSDRDD